MTACNPVILECITTIFNLNISVALYSILILDYGWVNWLRCVLFHGPVGKYIVTQCRFQVVLIWSVCIPVRRLSLSFLNDSIAQFELSECAQRIFFDHFNGYLFHFNAALCHYGKCDVRSLPFSHPAFHCNHFRVIAGIARQQKQIISPFSNDFYTNR